MRISSDTPCKPTESRNIFRRFLVFSPAGGGGRIPFKDPTKDCKQSPESFIGEYTAFVENIQQGVEFFRLPNYKEVLPAFSQEQLHTLMRLTDSCCKTLAGYLNFVKEICANG